MAMVTGFSNFMPCGPNFTALDTDFNSFLSPAIILLAFSALLTESASSFSIVSKSSGLPGKASAGIFTEWPCGDFLMPTLSCIVFLKFLLA